MSDTPQLLLAHHLKALKLPTFLREYTSLPGRAGWKETTVQEHLVQSRDVSELTDDELMRMIDAERIAPDARRAVRTNPTAVPMLAPARRG